MTAAALTSEQLARIGTAIAQPTRADARRRATVTIPTIDGGRRTATLVHIGHRRRRGRPRIATVQLPAGSYITVPVDRVQVTR